MPSSSAVAGVALAAGAAGAAMASLAGLGGLLGTLLEAPATEAYQIQAWNLTYVSGFTVNLR